jgi:hypothetical protein
MDHYQLPVGLPILLNEAIAITRFGVQNHRNFTEAVPDGVRGVSYVAPDRQGARVSSVFDRQLY